MAFGTLGSTLNDELNRLANGGTYRDKSAMVDEALAAKQWANRENIIPYSTDTVGILNEIAALGPNRQNWYDFNGVCNYLAGTTGLPAAAALRQITTTGDILTSLASYYVDAATPLGLSNSGYVYLNGSAGNFISTPDAAALDITGDIDLRAYIAPDTWIPAAASTIISKWLSTGNQRSFRFQITTAGLLSLAWTTDGATGTLIQVNSTVATGLSNTQAKWVRATLDVNNGASGYDVAFYTSDDGTTWTQLGTTVTAAGTASIYSGTANVEIGSLITGTTENLAAKVFRAQILNGIGGTTVLDANCSVVTSQSQTSFTATTGQTMTIAKTSEQVNILTNLGAAGSLLPTTVGSSLAADSNDPKFLDHTGTNYVYLPGVAANYLSVPDSAALDITGDIDIRLQVACDDWTPASNSMLASKFITTGNQRSWRLVLLASGTLRFAYTTDGSATEINKDCTVVNGLTDGSVKWIRVTLDVDNGSSQNETKFFTSDNGTTWTQLGSTITTAGTTSIFASTAPVELGSNDGGNSPSTAKIYRAQILNGIGGTTVLDVDTSVITTGAATSFTAVTGQTVTINRSTSGRKSVAVTQPTWLFGTDDYMEVNNRYMAHSTAAENYVYLSGSTGNYMSVADNPPLDITGDLDLRAKIALDDWTSINGVFGKWNSGANQRSYRLWVSADGKLNMSTSSDGTSGTVVTRTSSVAPTVTDGATLWIRTTLDVNNDAGGNDVKFWTSLDGNTWTQLGTTITNSGTAIIHSGTGNLEIGSQDGGANNPAKGKIYRAQILSGIDGTIVLDADASVITLPSQTTFVDRSSNAYTVTINKSGVGTFVSTGNYLYLPGVATNYASAPDSAALDITGDIDIRVKVALDDWTPSGQVALVSKWQSTATSRSFALIVNTSGTLAFQRSVDSVATLLATSSVATGIADGATKWVRATCLVNNGSGSSDVNFYTSDDGITWTQLGTTQTTAGTTATYSGTAVLEVGSITNGAGSNSRGKFFRAQVLNGIGGTVAFDANFENSITSLLQTSFTESSTNGATVTINRSGSTFRSAGVIDAGYLYPGATNTFAASATDFLNFGASDSMSIIMAVRQWDTPISNGYWMHKGTSSNTAYWYIRNQSTNYTTQFLSVDADGTVLAANGPTSAIPGTLDSKAFTLNRSTALATSYRNAVGGTSVSTTTTDSISNPGTLRIGTDAVLAGFMSAEIYAAAVFRSVLTAAQIRQISNYFANREVYL